MRQDLHKTISVIKNLINLEALSGLHKLENLSAQYNDIDSIEPIAHLERLRGYFYRNPRLEPKDVFKPASPGKRKQDASRAVLFYSLRH